MNRAEKLLESITIQKREIMFLEEQLKEIQLQCTHDFRNENTYRVCNKCKLTESNHY